ncbi:MAG: geranyl transferase [Gammaproteobacteria bacterium]|nr:geranyl transferase [Gammaproteobacteria bacterium]
MVNSFSKVIDRLQKRSNEQLVRCLDQAKAPEKLSEAMRYSVVNGGKRIRPILVYLTAEALGADLRLADKPATALELIHAYSLVHDDLPAMDDDDFRRGKASCHKQYDEATAILAGDALQTLAFQVIADTDKLSATIRIALISDLAKAVGVDGMVSGQALDLSHENNDVDLKELKQMHDLKTGALITTSVRFGGLVAEADKTTLALITDFGKALGLAFQIRDDILDATGNDSDIGKPTGSDEERGKSTYVTTLGLKEAHVRLKEQQSRADEIAASLGPSGASLQQLTNLVVTRNH